MNLRVERCLIRGICKHLFDSSKCLYTIRQGYDPVTRANHPAPDRSHMPLEIFGSLREFTNVTSNAARVGQSKMYASLLVQQSRTHGKVYIS